MKKNVLEINHNMSGIFLLLKVGLDIELPGFSLLPRPTLSSTLVTTHPLHSCRTQILVTQCAARLCGTGSRLCCVLIRLFLGRNMISFNLEILLLLLDNVEGGLAFFGNYLGHRNLETCHKG